MVDIFKIIVYNLTHKVDYNKYEKSEVEIMMKYEVIGFLKNEDMHIFVGVYSNIDTAKTITTECNSFFESMKINEVVYGHNVNKVLNNVCTAEKYLKYGFTVEEVALVREHDILFNMNYIIGLSDTDMDRLYDLVDILKL